MSVDYVGWNWRDSKWLYNPCLLLQPNRGGSKRGLARELEDGDSEPPQDQRQHEPTLLTRHDSELSLNEALNRSLLMATQAMEELSAMSAKEAEEKPTNQRYSPE